MKALRGFGLGIVWAILFPFILVGVFLVAIWGVFNFVIQFVIMLVHFFSGKKVFPMFPEEEKAYAILKRALDKQNGEIPDTPAAPAPQQVFVQQNFYTGAPPQMPGAPQALPPGYQQFPGAPNGFIPQNGQNPYMNQGQIPFAPNAIPVTPQAEEEKPPVPELVQIPQYDPNKGGDEQ